MLSLANRVAAADPATRLRSASADDAAFCRALFRELRQDQFAPLGLPEILLASLLDQQYRAQQSGFAQQCPQAQTVISTSMASASAGSLLR
jgi:hypothetical protein